eukprot:637376-Amphidinium_carterae.1
MLQYAASFKPRIGIGKERRAALHHSAKVCCGMWLFLSKALLQHHSVSFLPRLGMLPRSSSKVQDPLGFILHGGGTSALAHHDNMQIVKTFPVSVLKQKKASHPHSSKRTHTFARCEATNTICYMSATSNVRQQIPLVCTLWPAEAGATPTSLLFATCIVLICLSTSAR